MKFPLIALLSGSVFLATSLFPVYAGDIPSRVDISYSITSGTLEGEVNDTVEIKKTNRARSYSINSEGRAKGLPHEDFAWGNDGPRRQRLRRGG